MMIVFNMQQKPFLNLDNFKIIRKEVQLERDRYIDFMQKSII